MIGGSRLEIGWSLMRDVPIRSVVIVDDSVEFRQLLALHLDAMDVCVVAEATDARSGFATVVETNPDLVVTDLQMPGEDGLWLARQLRAAHPHLVVVMATGSKDSPGLAKQAFDAGVKRLVRKRDGAAKVAAAVQQELAG